MEKEEKLDPEGVWADPEAILRPAEGERLTSLIQEFDDERYPQLMALGWIKTRIGTAARKSDSSQGPAGSFAD